MPALGVAAVMSLARLSAGPGYRYLLRHTAVGDSCPNPGQSLSAYYTATGLPPGRWTGAGLPGLGSGDGADLRAGAAVTEEAMSRLYGTGRDPVTGEPLGRPYPAYKNAAKRIATRIDRLPDTLSADDRDHAIAQIEAQEKARPVRSAVAGYDLTFTAPKSVSVLWALGDEDIRRAVEAAHYDAVTAVLGLIEDRFLHTRIGDGSKIRVPARGAIATAFDHYDTRAGDPNLHTHLVIANKVQGPDGTWRAVDGQVLYAAAVACSEIYDTTFADLLSTRLGVRFDYRDRGPRRTPAYEIDGISDPLLTAFSARSAAIDARVQDLVAAFTDTHGRQPDRIEVIRLRQQATLATRPDKQITPLAQLRARWRATAETVTGAPVATTLHKALTSADAPLSSRPAIGPVEPATAVSSIVSTAATAEPPEAVLARYAVATVAGVSTRRATWTATNLLAEAARVTRALRTPDAASRLALLDRVVAAALERCIALDPGRPGVVQRYLDPAVSGNAATVAPFTGAAADTPEPAYTTWAILAAEARLLAAHADTTGPVVDPAPIHATAARHMPGTPRLSSDQVQAVAAIAASGRHVDVLVGSAGTGKTRTLFALRAAWERMYGAGSVIGLAPSAAAAAELAAALRIGADTLAKWTHESDPATATGEPWRLRAGQLVLLDEAAMAPTSQLDRLVAQTTAAGAKLVLVGDHCQLGAVDAGGAFALLAGEGHAVDLEQLHRFTSTWEAAATRQLRVGDPACLDAYTAHGRLHDGPAEAMTEAAYRAWAADVTAGRHSLLLAADRATVTALNRRARADRIREGAVHTDGEIRLRDSSAVGVGDLITTRRNDRRLTRPDGGHVRNGDRWHVTATHPDGSLDAAPMAGAGDRSSVAVRLPANCVHEHVELGYALTVHRAQGATADTTHLITGSGMSREALYVGLTRGRHANHAYVDTDSSYAETRVVDDEPTGRQILETVLRSPAAETSATSTLRRRQAEHGLALTRSGQWPALPEAQPIRPIPSAAPSRTSLPPPGLSR